VKSNAPLFDLQNDISSTGMIIASEIEALLAERLAAWDLDITGFISRLEQVEPLRLFIALIAKIEAEQKLIPNLARGGNYWNEEHALRSMIKALDQAGQWPLVPPRLEDLV
jgi:hypothetical protein